MNFEIARLVNQVIGADLDFKWELLTAQFQLMKHRMIWSQTKMSALQFIYDALIHPQLPILDDGQIQTVSGS